MPSISEELLKSVDIFDEQFKTHPLIKLHPYFESTKQILHKRLYNQISKVADQYNQLFKSAAEFAPTPEAKKYMLDIYSQSQQSHQQLLDEIKQFANNDLQNDTIPKFFTLQMDEWQSVLQKKDLALFMASHLGSWYLAVVMTELMADDIKVDFGLVYDYKVMAKWIDRLGPKEWDQKYFEELRNVCHKIIGLEMPAKYDYFLYGVN